MSQEIAAYATAVMAVLTLLLLLFNAYYVVKFRRSVEIQRKTAQGSMLLELNRDFFYREPHKSIIRRLEEGQTLRGISDEDLDDHIGFLDTLGTFVRAGILEVDLVWAVFSHYVESAQEHPQIREYIERVRVQANDKSYFEDFDLLYKKMKKMTVERQSNVP